MDDALKVNRDFWNKVVPLHTSSAYYNIEDFKSGGSSLHTIEREELGNVEGKTLLHLQCHFGMDTLSWARLGARVTGVDFSEQAIALAQSLKRELGLEAEFVCSNIYDLPNMLSGTFDLVFSSYGVLCWLPDVEQWANVIAHFLKPGGTFYIIDGHPLINIFSWEKDASSVREIQVSSSYFSSEPVQDEAEGTYAQSTLTIPMTRVIEWKHSLSSILNALIQAGLTIEFLHEFPTTDWALFPFLKQGEDNLWRLNLDEPQLPLLFSVKATKRQE